MTPLPAESSMHDLSERVLIERIVAGERNLFHDLVRPYERRAYLIAWANLRNSGDAEDAVQQAFLKIFSNLGSLQDAARFAPWAMRIVANEARMARRKLRPDLYESFDGARQPQDEDPVPRPRDFADWRELPSEALDRKELRAALQAAMAALPTIYQQVFVLRDVEHLSVAETARILNVSTPVVKTRLHRARLMLREALSPAFARPRTSFWERWKGANPWFSAKL
jgi:RNA polymerase sigma-70 factor (ECF subfamily)